MNIVFEVISGGDFTRILGLKNALVYCGHNVYLWDKNKPIQDVFDELGQVDIFFGTTYSLTRAIISALKNSPQTKVLLKGGNFGSYDDEIDRKKYPILFITEQEKELFKNWKPDFVFCHYLSDYLEDTMGKWESELGIKVMSICNAADTIDYGPGTFKPELLSDISFVGGKWPYKSQNIDKYLIPLLSPVGRYNIKIWGNQGWSMTPQYLGVAETPTLKDIFKSATINLNISEPHSTELSLGFDVVERPFKVCSAGGFCISDKVDGLNEVFQGAMPAYSNIDEFENLIAFYLNPDNKEHRKRSIEQCREIVLNGHTYFHRLADIFSALYLDNELFHVLEKYNEHKQSL